MKIRAYYFIIMVLFSTSIFSAADNEPKLDPEIQRALDRQWDFNYETKAKTATMLLPRLLGHMAYYVVFSETAARVANVFRIPGDKAEGGLQRSYYRLNSSALNPLPTASGVVSDIGTIVKSPIYSTARLSTRISVCSASVTQVYGLDPTNHISIGIDQNEVDEINQPQICRAVPIVDNISESIAIQRLTCIQESFFPRECGLFTYNCGALARDTLKFAGLGFPSFPNLGIGSALTPIEQKNLFTKDCDQKIYKYKKIFTDLETSKPIAKYEEFANFHSPLSNDLMLQLIISAARGKNAANRTMLAHSDISWRIQKAETVYIKKHPIRGYLPRPNLKNMLKRMFIKMDTEAVNWLKNDFGPVYNIYTSVAGKDKTKRQD